jgi:sugar O-acyltransferase (sialic acid O-acetyltransferase NeuD family)
VLRELTAHLGFDVVALFDNDPSAASPFSDVPLFHGMAGFDRWRAAYGDRACACLVAIGGSRGADRHAIQRQLADRGLTPVSAVHPTAFVAASAAIGPGTQILARATVAVDVIVGEACIVNTAASVDHECRLGDGVHVCPGATLAGCVEVGNYVMIGSGAVILPRRHIGRGAIVGAGAVVIRDVPERTVVVGNPARVVRSVDDRAGALVSSRESES